MSASEQQAQDAEQQNNHNEESINTQSETAQSQTEGTSPEQSQDEETAAHKPVQVDLQDLLEAVQAHGKKTVQQQDEAAAGKVDADGKQYDDAILDSSAIEPTDDEGNPIPVTIPIVLTPNITVVYTTRLGGASTGEWAHFNLGGKSGDVPDHVHANRDALANELHAKLSIINQVHSGKAIDIDEHYVENHSFGFDASGTQGVPVDDVESVDGKVQIIEGDAQVTTKTGIALGVFAADCLPVLLADPITGVIAAAHCGRKGLMEGVIPATIEMMKAKGANPAHIVATLGPAICGDCYEVGDAIADEFDAKFPGTFTLTRFGGPGIDLNKAALIALEAAGINSDHIYSSQPRVNAATQYLAQDPELQQLCREDNEGDPALDERIKNIRHSMCTLENPLWFSHRRAQLAHKEHEGRMLALIVRQ